MREGAAGVSRRRWLLAILAGALGYALNLLDVELLPGMQLLFGAVPAFLVAAAYGAGPGALAGALASLRVLALWGHPFGWITLALESATVGVLCKRVRPVFAVVAFWAGFGLWFGIGSYYLVLDVSAFVALLAVLKQVLNGLINALMAEAILLWAPARRTLRLDPRAPIRQYLGVLAALGAGIPLLSIWIVATRQQTVVAVRAAEAESRIAVRALGRQLATAAAARTVPDSASLATLSIPSVTLHAMVPDSVEATVAPGGRLTWSRATMRGRGAIIAAEAVAATGHGVRRFIAPQRLPIPMLQTTASTLVVAERIPGTRWIAWAEVPFAHILTPLGFPLLVAEAVMIAALLSALGLALLVARQLERPIAALVTTTQRLAVGNQHARAEPETTAVGPREPVLLARSLDEMAERLEQVQRERGSLLAAERSARAEAERRALEEEALRLAAQAVTASFTVDEVVRQIAGSALVATRADGAYVERVDSARGIISVAAAAGEIHPEVGAELPLAGSYAELTLERGQAILVPVLGEAERPLAAGISGRCPDCAAMVLPLLDSGTAIGALLLLRREGNAFRKDEVQRALTFANLAALAFRKVHLLEESEQRREELEHVMESRARLIRGFSHDVKNPLGAADGYLQLLEEQILGEMTPKQHESVTRVRRAVHGALALIDDLVEIAKAEAGQLDVHPHAVDARDLVWEMVGEYRAQAEAAGLSVLQDIPPELPLLRSDDRRIRQVLGNLLSNAVKYTPAGGRIGARVGLRNANGTARLRGECVAIDVWDTGAGIPPDRRERMFQEFTRLEPSRTAGAGLGLAISRRVARALGGDLTFESEPGQGSTFTLWLPREWPGAGD